MMRRAKDLKQRSHRVGLLEPHTIAGMALGARSRGRGMRIRPSQCRDAHRQPVGHAAMTDTLRVDIWRGTESGQFQPFAIPRREHQTVLDVVTEIQREHDATLSYRFACRVGMCGSCAMVVNGRPRWTCRTRVSEAVDGDTLKLEPLRNFTVVKDLAVDMAAFFDKWRDAKGHFIPGEPKADFAVVPPSSPERRAADAGIEC